MIRARKSRLPNVINKNELAKIVAQKERLSLEEVVKIIDAYCTEIARAVIAGKRVTLYGFGRFEIKKNKAYAGKKFGGKACNIPEMETIKFKPTRSVTRKINR